MVIQTWKRNDAFYLCYKPTTILKCGLNKIKMVTATLARKYHDKPQVSCGSAWFQIKGGNKKWKGFFWKLKTVWRSSAVVYGCLVGFYLFFFFFNLQKVYSILNNNRCPRSECRAIIHSQGSAAVHKLLRRCLTSAESRKWITAPYPHWGHTLLDATDSQDTVGSCHQPVCRQTGSEAKIFINQRYFF